MKAYFYFFVLTLALTLPAFAADSTPEQGAAAIDFETYYKNAQSVLNADKSLPGLDYPGFGLYLWNEAGLVLKDNNKSMCAIGTYACKTSVQAMMLDKVPAVFRSYATAEDSEKRQKEVYLGLARELRAAYGTPSNYYENNQRMAEEWVGVATTVILEMSASGVSVTHSQTR